MNFSLPGKSYGSSKKGSRGGRQRCATCGAFTKWFVSGPFRGPIGPPDLSFRSIFGPPVLVEEAYFGLPVLILSALLIYLFAPSLSQPAQYQMSSWFWFGQTRLVTSKENVTNWLQNIWCQFCRV